jgi:hypothetical protein
MFIGTDDLLSWFQRTKKTGWRLLKGKDIIAEYFDEQASNDTAYATLSTELSSLAGGTYHIDAKDNPKLARQILSTDFIIKPNANQPAAVSGPIHAGVPEGYVKATDMAEAIRKEMELYDMRRKIKELEAALLEAANAPAEKPDYISGLLEDDQVKATIAGIMQMGAAKLFGQRQIAIAGGLNQVPPQQRAPQTQQAQPQAEAAEATQDEDALTDNQNDRLDEAFFACVDQIGGVDPTLDLLECLPLYIAANPGMFKNVLKPELLKYKKQS